MTTDMDVLRALRAEARRRGRNLGELLVLYGLERTLDRLTRTEYADAFILKGGVLLAAFDQRRVTRDIDLQATAIELSPALLVEVVRAIAAVETDDGLVFDDAMPRVEVIREDAEYEGLRALCTATLGRSPVRVQLDVSTGDPVWPAPQRVVVPGLLGDDVTIMGHPMPTVVAEKSVTILQRGTTSTRWRDYVDIVNLARAHAFAAGDLRTAARAVAEHRGEELRPLAASVAGYGDVAQGKWAAWRTTNDLVHRSAAHLDDQMSAIVQFIDPVYAGESAEDSIWNPDSQAWERPSDTSKAGR
ncbi:nucleotidyl transferase AbiEii/AbiGii toxin family protein [Cellulosimicrobium marinum]|uniref:nucleotidyl transferase AbiEii/AbiGii toxin family protein n=1 Tax=Cellulosimicrobium marinum TaxID=1638992 RepID=UPI001E5A8712|nr:nucleotidyl transferase AbiEii/AbiGii toxin family protein [Cellulosimicrobium marinum]MCB7138170.1 nucleotidyl transferase AbiEii/AbiGii toxin family protein [Cellulosimicrobium marinum]